MKVIYRMDWHRLLYKAILVVGKPSVSFKFNWAIDKTYVTLCTHIVLCIAGVTDLTLYLVCISIGFIMPRIKS
jgi:hypothetical protein